MNKNKIIIFVLLIVSTTMISIALMFEEAEGKSLNGIKVDDLNIHNMAMATSLVINKPEETIKPIELKEVPMEVVPASIVREEVYDGLTFDELAAKLNRVLKGYIGGTGAYVAKECLDKGVDPYVAVAIMMHETGCNGKCSKLVVYCNNVGGQKGRPSCNGGSFRRFDTLEEGITGFINNLSRNYYALGLNTVELIAPKYCEGNQWAGKIHYYINKIKAA